MKKLFLMIMFVLLLAVVMGCDEVKLDTPNEALSDYYIQLSYYYENDIRDNVFYFQEETDFLSQHQGLFILYHEDSLSNLEYIELEQGRYIYYKTDDIQFLYIKADINKYIYIYKNNEDFYIRVSDIKTVVIEDYIIYNGS